MFFFVCQRRQKPLSFTYTYKWKSTQRNRYFYICTFFSCIFSSRIPCYRIGFFFALVQVGFTQRRNVSKQKDNSFVYTRRHGVRCHSIWMTWVRKSSRLFCTLLRHWKKGKHNKFDDIIAQTHSNTSNRIPR